MAKGKKTISIPDSLGVDFAAKFIGPIGTPERPDDYSLYKSKNIVFEPPAVSTGELLDSLKQPPKQQWGKFNLITGELTPEDPAGRADALGEMLNEAAVVNLNKFQGGPPNMPAMPVPPYKPVFTKAALHAAAQALGASIRNLKTPHPITAIYAGTTFSEKPINGHMSYVDNGDREILSLSVVGNYDHAKIQIGLRPRRNYTNAIGVGRDAVDLEDQSFGLAAIACLNRLADGAGASLTEEQKMELLNAVGRCFPFVKDEQMNRCAAAVPPPVSSALEEFLGGS